jgi:hypothetical protein
MEGAVVIWQLAGQLSCMAIVLYSNVFKGIANRTSCWKENNVSFKDV